MTRSIILLGDTTTHGGEVITGSEQDRVNGRPIARLGDQVRCPRHGVNPIIEGDACTLLDGRPVALEGHRARCGCRLVGSGNGSVG